MAKTSNPKRARGRPRQDVLNRDRVLAEALALLDREGPDALTMRHLAGVLNVSPMALYNHVRSKKDLLRSVAEHLVGQVEFSSDHRDWRERIRICFRRLRGVILAHPGALWLMDSVEEAPLAVFSPLEVTLAALHEAGLTGEPALKSYFLLANFTLGQVSYEVRGPSKTLDPATALASGRLQGAGFEHIERAIAFEHWDFDSAFEFGLSAIIAGLEQIGVDAARRGE